MEIEYIRDWGTSLRVHENSFCRNQWAVSGTILKIRSRSCNFIFVKLNTNVIHITYDTYENFCPNLFHFPIHVNILEEKKKKLSIHRLGVSRTV